MLVKLSGPKRMVGIRYGDADLQCSILGIDGGVDEVETSALRIIAAVDQLQSKHRGVVGRLARRIPQLLLELDQLLLADGEIDVDRVDRVERGQQRR